MNDKSKNNKKGFITEEDIASLLQRYSATTVLTLLQEVAQCPGAKRDWNELVKKTSTGISNAWEYQMLWRHLAYHGPLLQAEDRNEPLDDDSDLEYELEAFPHVNSEAAAEAAACVKVMIASRLPSESNLPSSSTVEAPLVINIPNGTSPGPSESSQATWSTSGVNITVPVSVQKQPLPAATSIEVPNVNGSARGTFPPRRKRKPWSSDEDMELIAAVEKFGEGNWANILKGDFKGNRTASQLSQRWALIRKKGFGNMLSGTNQLGLQRTEAQMAANHALSLAVGHRPTAKSMTAAGAPSNGVSGNNSLVPSSNAETTTASIKSSQTQKHSQHLPVQTSSAPAATASSLAKSQVIMQKGPVNTKHSSDPVVTANATGAVATSVSVALTDPGKSDNCIQAGGSSTKPPVASSVACAQKNVQTDMPANKSGMISARPSSAPRIVSGLLRPGSVCSAQKAAQNVQCTTAVPSNTFSCQAKGPPACGLTDRPQPAKSEPAKENIEISRPKDDVQANGTCSYEQANGSQQETTALPPSMTAAQNQSKVSEEPDSSSNMEVEVKSGQDDAHRCAEKNQKPDESKPAESNANGTGTLSEMKDSHTRAKVDKSEDPLAMVKNGLGKSLEVAAKAECSNGL